MSERGVYAIDRGLWDDPDFADEPYTERQAWAWLIGAAAWKDSRVRCTRGPVMLKRSEFSFSVRFLATKWQWSKSRVDRFLDTLKKRDMLRDASRDGAQIYCVKNYNSFQRVGLPKRDSERDEARDDVGTAAGHERDKEETLKHSNIKTSSLRSEVRRSPPKAGFKLPEWVPSEPWSAFEESRRRLRKPLTDKARMLAIGELEKLRGQGHDPTAVLNQSVMNGWAGVFKIRQEDENAGRGRGRQRSENRVDTTWRGVSSFVGEDREDAGEADSRGTQSPAALPAPRRLAAESAGPEDYTPAARDPPGSSGDDLPFASFE